MKRHVLRRRGPIARLAALGASLGCVAAASQAQRPAPTRIVLLGTGTPNATPDRMGPSLAIVVGDRPYLVDAGPGVVRRAAAAQQEGVDALRVPNLRHLFVTHLHSDHTIGYPDLILTPWVLDRDLPLEAYGPPGLKAMTEHLLAAYREDVEIRLNGLEPANADGHKVNVHEVGAGVVHEDAEVRVEAFAVPHGSWKHALGYKFKTADGVIVVSGDTGPFEGMAGIARGADVLIHEAYSTVGLARRPEAWRRYHSAFHTSGRMVGEIAEKSGVATVILTHQLTWSATDADLLAEVRSAFGGRVISGKDLDVFELSELKRREGD